MNNEELRLVTLLRQRGLAWAIDIFKPSADAAAHYLASLRDLERHLQEKGLGTNTFSPESLEHLVSVSHYKADAFLQALVSIRSTSMLCAAWRILQGMEIASVDMQYRRLLGFELRVVLRSPHEEEEEYRTADISDAVFVRHLGKATIDKKPYFDGFYALRLT
jgi:hypothetical protein